MATFRIGFMSVLRFSTAGIATVKARRQPPDPTPCLNPTSFSRPSTHSIKYESVTDLISFENVTGSFNSSRVTSVT